MDLLSLGQKTAGVFKTSVLKKILIGLGILVVVAFGIAIAIGYSLPREIKIERSMEILAPAEKIYQYLEDPRAWGKWTVWTRREFGLETIYTGPAQGVGAKWTWKSKIMGNVDMVITRAEPSTVIEYKQTFEDADLMWAGMLKLAPAGSGTKVVWISEGNIGSNPITRYTGLLIETMLERDFDGGLANLKSLAEEGPGMPLPDSGKPPAKRDEVP